MAWPTDDIVTTNVDAGSDSAASARANIYTALLRIKDIIAGRNTANGVAPLDASSKVPVANIPTLSYLPSSGGTVSGGTTFGATLAVTGAATLNSTLQVASNVTVTSGTISTSANSIAATKSSQTDYASAGLRSIASTGNAGLGLQCASSAAYIEHANGGNGIAVKDSVGSGADVTARKLLTTGTPYMDGTTNVTVFGGAAGVCRMIATGDPTWQADTGDSISYALSSNAWKMNIGSTTVFQISASDVRVPIIYNTTTANAASVFVDANGILYRSTSLRKHKTDIAPIEEGQAFDLIQAMQFRSVLPADGARRFYGFIADDVAAAVPEAATWDAAGNPEGINDRALIALLWREVQALRARVAALEAER